MQVVYADAPAGLDWHRHNAHELLYVASGRAQLTIMDAKYELGPHRAAFISNLEEHTIQPLEVPYERYFITVDIAEFAQMNLAPPLTSIFRMRPEGFSHCVQLPDGAALIEDRLRAMVREATTGGEWSQDALRQHFALLLIDFIRIVPSAFPEHGRPHPTFVEAAQQFIDVHYAEPIRVRDIAERHFISESTLTHAFKRATGMSLQQYRTLTRLSAAREQLLLHGDSVDMAAAKAGFTDVNYFIRCFRSRYGQTPKQYQLSQARGAEGRCEGVQVVDRRR